MSPIRILAHRDGRLPRSLNRTRGDKFSVPGTRRFVQSGFSRAQTTTAPSLPDLVRGPSRTLLIQCILTFRGQHAPAYSPKTGTTNARKCALCIRRPWALRLPLSLKRVTTRSAEPAGIRPKPALFYALKRLAREHHQIRPVECMAAAGPVIRAFVFPVRFLVSARTWLYRTRHLQSCSFVFLPTCNVVSPPESQDGGESPQEVRNDNPAIFA